MAQAIRLSLVFRLVILGLVVIAEVVGRPVFGLVDLFTVDRPSIAEYVDRSHRAQGLVVKFVSGNSTDRLVLANLVIDDAKLGDRLQISMPRFSKVAEGDRVSFNCLLKRPEAFDGVPYDRILAARDIYATCRVSSAPLVIESGESKWRGVLFRTRRMVERLSNQTFGEPAATLFSGMLIGEADFTDDWTTIFRRTGTMHMVAASGFNVMMVSELALMIFALFLPTKRIAGFGVFVVIVAYVLLCGAGSAIVRAGVMGIIGLVAQVLQRPREAINALMLAGGLMLIANPLLLFWDVGFQLSMLATAGLILLSPHIGKRLWFVPEGLMRTRSALSTALSATIATLPISIVSFNNVPIVSPLVNALVTPLIEPAMALGVLAVIVKSMAPQLAIPIIFVAQSTLSMMLDCIRLFSNLPWASYAI